MSDSLPPDETPLAADATQYPTLANKPEAWNSGSNIFGVLSGTGLALLSSRLPESHWAQPFLYYGSPSVGILAIHVGRYAQRRSDKIYRGLVNTAGVRMADWRVERDLKQTITSQTCSVAEREEAQSKLAKHRAEKSDLKIAQYQRWVRGGRRIGHE